MDVEPTADLCDAAEEGRIAGLQVAQPGLVSLGGRRAFGGPIRTVRAPEDNTLVREALEGPGDGAVLVVDGMGSAACALLGDRLGALAARNGWSGVVVHGCVRDAAALGRLELGVLALWTCPRRSRKLGRGERGVPVSFLGVCFRPGDQLSADEDGLVTWPANGPRAQSGG